MKRKNKEADISFLCEQMVQLLRAGFPLIQVFRILEQDLKSDVLGSFEGITKELNQGQDLVLLLKDRRDGAQRFSSRILIELLGLYLNYGGNVIEALEGFRAMTERSQQDQKFHQIYMAQGKASMMIMIFLWFGALAVLALFSQQAFLYLITESLGRGLLLVSFLLLCFGIFGVYKVLSRKPWRWQRKKQLEQQILKEFPFFLQLVKFIIESGKSMSYALNTVYQEGHWSFGKVQKTWEMARNQEGLRPFQSLFKSLDQAQSLGGSVGMFLDYQISNIEIRQRQQQEEQARLGVIKMSLPLSLFLFPSLLLLYIGPSFLLFLDG